MRLRLLFFLLFSIAFGFLNAADPLTPTIVIDPGHGGTDRGARAKPPYCEEKKISLLTARLLKKYLDQLGYHVVMTRNNDAFVSLQDRVEIANQADCNIFVSVHFNSSRHPSAQGIEVFYSESGGAGRSSSSKKLADSVLSRVIRQTSANSRGVKRGNFYVIRETAMPSVLVEGGFISNDEERSNLKTREYQEKIARGIADGIDNYFKQRWQKAASLASAQ